MRQLNYALVLTAVLLSLLGCDKSDSPSPGPEEEVIHFRTQIMQSDSQVSDNDFEPGDVMGFYVVPYSADNTTPGNIVTSDYAVNVPYIYDGTGWEQQSGTEVVYPAPGRKVDLYGYYPYDASLTDTDPTRYLFALADNQQTLQGYYDSDFLWARQNGVTPTTAQVPLTFYHRMSKVIVNVRSDLQEIQEGFDATEVWVNTRPEVYVDLSDGTLTLNTAAAAREIPIYRVAAPAEGYDVSFEGIVVPQQLSTGTEFIRIINNEVPYFYRLVDNLTLTSGTTVTFNLTITNQGILVTVSQIDEWIDAGEVGGNVGQPAPYVVDISQIDWTRSLVYRIYDDGVQIGQVAREYIFLNNQVSYQAIVVYPMGTDGAINLQAGFIAQAMSTERNADTDMYELDPASVHGGSVNFDAASNVLTSFTAGTQPPFNKVEIVSSNQVRGAADNAVDLLTLEPEIMTDADGNNYPLVKIATQYWMADNYRVEHYNDGTDLTYYYYNNVEANKLLIGGLYFWATATDARFAPVGWHLPSYEEMISLQNYLGTGGGAKLKANRLWSNLTNSNNLTGWSGLPGGRRTDTGVFNEALGYGQWWTATSYSTNEARRMFLDYGNPTMQQATLPKNYTQSVRLLRD